MVLGLLFKFGERGELKIIEAWRISGLTGTAWAHQSALEQSAASVNYSSEAAQGAAVDNIAGTGKFRSQCLQMYECENGKRWREDDALSTTCLRQAAYENH